MGVLLRNVVIADVPARRLIPADIHISAAVIEAVEPGLPAAGCSVVDCEGRFAVPGLMDMHIHLRGSPHSGPTMENPVPAGDEPGAGPGGDARNNGQAPGSGLISRLHSFLYTGVTSIYDAGNDPDVILPLRSAERSGQIAAPRIFCTGSLLTCPGGHGHQIGATQIAALPADERALTDFLGAEPDVVKITYDEHNWGVRPLIPILSPDTLRQIIRFCHEHRRRVTVHVSNELRAREAVEAGADSLAHPVIQSPITEEFAWLVAAKRIPVVSTLTIGERYSRVADHPEFADEPMYAACMSQAEREHLKAVESPHQQRNPWAAWMKVMTPIAQENIRRLVAAGGTVVTGTDLSLGPEYHRELALLQEGGLQPWEVLQAATQNAGVFLGRADLGTIRPGQAADLLLVEDDPTADIRNLAKIWQVYKGGELVDRAGLRLPSAD
jgi:imidazolonepropionase-like amidohydrolase